MQALRKLALAICLSVFAFATPNFVQAAPIAGISQAAPAVTAGENSSNTAPMVQKAWWRCWHCYHRWGWHRWHYWHPYWHRCWHCWHRWHYWHRW